MKKLLVMLLTLSVIVMPIKVEAKSYNFGGYYCDNKVAMDNNEFSMTCHIVVSTDYPANHIQANLILKNVSLVDVKTNSDWVNNNGYNDNMDFTARTTHQGSFTVADLVFVGSLDATECEASIEPLVVEEVTLNNPVCAILDGQYYGKNANVVTEERYYEECYNYTCTVVDNKYYFNRQGKSVDYNSFLEDCSGQDYVPSNPQTGVNYGYIILPIGILSIIAIVKFTKKNSKIYKI